MVDEIRQDSDEYPNGRDAKGRFAPGNPGGPGRPKGLRDRLDFDFVNELQREFEARGKAVVQELDAKTLCEIIVKVLPKETKVEVGEAYADLLRRAADVLASRR